jgi:acylphosphatase
MMKRIRIIAGGRVQGVGYRVSVQERVSRLGVVGYVRNLPDGRVELVAEGTESELEEVLAIAQEGSPFSDVTDISITEEKPEGEFDSFGIRN